MPYGLYQPINESFGKKLESVQYNAALDITGAIKGTSQEKLYKEFGLESLKLRRKLRHLCTFYIIETKGLPAYLFRLIPNTTYSYQTKALDNIITNQYRTEAFNSSFFPGLLLNEIVWIYTFVIHLRKLSKNT